MAKPSPIFIFAYYSYNDPIFQSAVLPYFLNFKGNYQFIILTFEQNQYALSKSDFNKIKSNLAKQNIVLYRTKWNSGAFKAAKKIYDFVKGIFISEYLILKHGAKLIYSEGFPGAIIAHYLSKINSLPHIIHTFEPHAEYMLESGVWSQNSWEYRIQKKVELVVANRASTLFTATNAYVQLLKDRGVSSNIKQIPSCVDTTTFSFSEKERQITRTFLNYTNDDIVICYLGKFGGMYMDSELFKFYNLCIKNNNRFKLLIISVEDDKKIYELAKQENIAPSQFQLVKLPRNKIPAYLSASDWGFIAVKPLPSKRFCSPIKTGEYWATGLPIIIPNGVADDFEMTKAHNLGISFTDINEKLVDQVLLSSNNKYDRKNIAHFCYNDRDISIFKNQLEITFDNLLLSN